jgi:hypothetical protein
MAAWRCQSRNKSPDFACDHISIGEATQASFLDVRGFQSSRYRDILERLGTRVSTRSVAPILPQLQAPTEVAEKPLQAVIPSGALDRTVQSGARNLALSIFNAERHSSSPMAPRNDGLEEFFRSVFSNTGSLEGVFLARAGEGKRETRSSD